MHPTLAAPARIPLMLGVLLAVAACADQSTPTAPAAPPASSLGVNNGGNNRRILFASTRDEIGNMEIYSGGLAICTVRSCARWCRALVSEASSRQAVHPRDQS